MTVQECIAVICQNTDLTYEGSFMQVHPLAPASCGGGGGLRERRYRFSIDGNTITFNTRGVRARAKSILYRA